MWPFRSQDQLKQTVLQLISHNLSSNDILNELSCIKKDETFDSSLIAPLGFSYAAHVTKVTSQQQFGCQAADRYIEKIVQLVNKETPETEKELVNTVSLVHQLILNGYLTESGFHDNLCRHMDLPLSLLWILHKEGVVAIETHFCKMMNRQGFGDEFCRKVVQACIKNDTTNVVIATEVVIGILSECVELGYAEEASLQSPARDLAASILQSVVLGLVDEAMKSPKHSAGSVVLFDQSKVGPAALKKASSSLIVAILSHKPVHKVSQAIRDQHNWAYGQMPAALIHLYKQLMIPFGIEEVLHILRQVLDEQEVSWQLLLSLVSVVVVCYQNSTQHILDMTDALVQEGLEGCDMESTITGFLLARQACLHGPHVFMAYPEWFQRSFSEGANCPVKTRKSFTFLMKFLTDLMPHESAQHIKVHIARPPFVPPKCRDILADYILLAKTRLQDLKEILDDNSKDGGVTNGNTKSGDSAQQEEVDNAVTVFASSGKLPTSIIEASIFRKPYYIGQFLPQLLKPRPLPNFPDPRMKLITALKNAGKIPLSMFTNYERECQRESAQLLEGVFLDSDSDGEMETSDLDLLLSSLHQLVAMATRCGLDPAQKVKYTETELVTLICERIEACFSLKPWPGLEPIPVIMIERHTINLPETQLKVINSILNTIAECLHAEKGLFHSVTWLPRFLLALTQYPVVMKTLCHRIWTLCCWQLREDYQDVHVKCLAGILVEMELLGNRVPKVFTYTSKTEQCQFPTFILQHLPIRTSWEMEFSLRILMSCLQYVILTSSSTRSVNPSPIVIKKFMYLATRLHTDLRFSSSDKLVAMATDSDVEAIFTSEFYQNLLATEQLSFQEWVGYELDVDPNYDALDEMERYNYHMWVVHTHFMGPCVAEKNTYRSMASIVIQELVQNKTRTQDTFEKSCPRCDNSSQNTSSSNKVHMMSILQNLTQMFTIGDSSNHKDELPWLQKELLGLVKRCSDSDSTCAIVHVFIRVCLCLPAYLFFSDLPGSLTEQCTSLQSTLDNINTIVIPYLSEGLLLPAGIVAFLIQGFAMTKDAVNPSSALDQLCDRCPALLPSILANHEMIRPLLCPRELNTKISQLMKAVRNKSFSDVGDPMLAAVGMFSGIYNNTSCNFEWLKTCLIYNSSQRQRVTQNLESAMKCVLDSIGPGLLGNLLSWDTGDMAFTLPHSISKTMLKCAILRCLAENSDRVKPHFVGDMRILASLLKEYAIFRNVIMAEGNLQTDMNPLTEVTQFVLKVLEVIPKEHLTGISQELILDCGPAVVEAVMLQLTS
ncbi:Fanconi anemia group A protein homolog isoform X2 [Dreissena polymorpha]|uniref:Fanconi anemia group A protein homolog isoform X2 n=1 Tax=Dreissena polymorpha TaxID=45954 RepID=UPI00226451E3|nr:Fanconi anemia group A protein homolog isoform X2 [Dreissena polymorpha]